MKRYIKFLFCSLLLTACTEILDKEDPSAVSPKIWNDEVTATLFLNALYEKALPAAGFGANSSNSDESPGGDVYMYGNVEVKTVTDYSLANYTDIRNINIAIEEIAKGNLNQEVKDKLSGQAFFLRAWKYWNLVNLYGGVPLVLSSLNPYEDELNFPRNKTSECIDQIVADLDIAIAGLPSSWPDSDRGRITRGAAAALKSRVLLFWASPQFNPTNALDRWERAYTASKEAKAMLIEDGRALQSNFNEIFLTEGANNKEFIFGRLFDYTAGKTHGWENSARPRVVGADGGNNSNPTIDLVNAFPMKNGKAISDPESGYDPILFWKDRDPRFAATIAYNGTVWDFSGFPTGRKQWHYYYYDKGALKSVETSSPTLTGFYTRKAINPNIPKDQVKLTGTDWIEIRFAEVLLNLAECANEVSKIEEAYEELKAIRARAKIDIGDGFYGLKQGMSIDEMREVILNERRIEFAFENKRYWDLRRRNLFATKLNGTQRYGIRTVLKPEYTNKQFEAIRDNIDLNAEFDKYFTIEPWLKDEKFTINYPQPKYNFFAIPQNMIDRSQAVEQTQSWEEGTFDPLQ
jgi:starch-binding outer membrane protein, SusD/RagB family